MNRRSALLGALLAATGLGLAQVPAGERLAYRFEEVKSKVVRSPGGDEARDVRVAAGDAADAGDVVRTGFFGRTVLAVPERAARFEVFSSSRVQLAGGQDPSLQRRMAKVVSQLLLGEFRARLQPVLDYGSG